MTAPPIRDVDANGLRFAYLDYGDASAPLVLMLHGFPDTAHTWKELAPAIAAQGFHVVTPWMRGYPPTTIPADLDASVLTLGKDVLALIAALTPATPTADASAATPAVVVGHDWGAFATYAAAAWHEQRDAHPDVPAGRIAKIAVLAIPHPRSLSPSLTALRKASHFVTFQLRGRAVRDLRASATGGGTLVADIYAKWSPGWRHPDDELAPFLAAVAADPRAAEGMLSYYWRFVRDAVTPSVRRMLGAPTSIPALSIFGEDDGALLLDVDAHAQSFTGRHDVVVVPGAGHFVHREARDVVLARLSAFLST